MKRLILLVVMLCGTALWPIHPAPAPSVAFRSTAGLFRAPTSLMHRMVNGRDLGPVDGSFGPDVILRRVGASFLTPRLLAQSVEVASLTTPETKPSNTQYAIERITETVDDPATPADEGTLVIQLTGLNKEAVSCVYNATTTPTGTTLITGQNKANFSTAYAGNATTGSRRQRIFHRLVVMGESTQVCGKTITGTVAGVVP